MTGLSSNTASSNTASPCSLVVEVASCDGSRSLVDADTRMGAFEGDDQPFDVAPGFKETDKHYSFDSSHTVDANVRCEDTDHRSKTKALTKKANLKTTLLKAMKKTLEVQQSIKRKVGTIQRKAPADLKSKGRGRLPAGSSLSRPRVQSTSNSARATMDVDKKYASLTSGIQQETITTPNSSASKVLTPAMKASSCDAWSYSQCADSPETAKKRRRKRRRKIKLAAPSQQAPARVNADKDSTPLNVSAAPVKEEVPNLKVDKHVSFHEESEPLSSHDADCDGIDYCFCGGCF